RQHQMVDARRPKWIGQETPLDREWRISTWNEYLEVEGSVMLVAEDEGKLVGMKGYLRMHWRRKSGELWDSVVMGLVLEDTEPDAVPH
ncbi:MAG: hypothetical protein ABI571_07400, partial [Actinomycetota bacterium]